MGAPAAKKKEKICISVDVGGVAPYAVCTGIRVYQPFKFHWKETHFYQKKLKDPIYLDRTRHRSTPSRRQLVKRLSVEPGRSEREKNQKGERIRRERAEITVNIEEKSIGSCGKAVPRTGNLERMSLDWEIAENLKKIKNPLKIESFTLTEEKHLHG